MADKPIETKPIGMKSEGTYVVKDKDGKIIQTGVLK